MKEFGVKIIALAALATLFVIAFDTFGQDRPQESRGELSDSISDESIAILFEDENGNLKQRTMDGTISDPVSTEVFERFVLEKSPAPRHIFSVYDPNEYVAYRVAGLGYSQDFLLGDSKTGKEELLLHIPGSSEDENFRDYKRPYPIEWISPDEVLVTEGGIETYYEGLARFNVRTKEYKSLNIQNAYGHYVWVSPNGNWALGKYNSDGYYDSVHGTTDKSALINLKTGQEYQIFDHTKIKGWIVIDKQYKDLNSASQAEFSFLDCGNGENCTLPGAPIFYFPFECGSSYAVSRDGECNTPAECGLYPGTSAFLSWHNHTGAHNRAAIDFSDNQLAGTSNPGVYTTASGFVDHAGWENPNDPNQGFGLYVRIICYDENNNVTGIYYLGHFNSLVVSQGQFVSVGDLLGYEGSTGQSSGEHIHFELKDQFPGGKVSGQFFTKQVLALYLSKGTSTPHKMAQQ